MSNMVETHLLMVLMLEFQMHETHRMEDRSIVDIENQTEHNKGCVY